MHGVYIMTLYYNNIIILCAPESPYNSFFFSKLRLESNNFTAIGVDKIKSATLTAPRNRVTVNIEYQNAFIRRSSTVIRSGSRSSRSSTVVRSGSRSSRSSTVVRSGSRSSTVRSDSYKI